MSTYVGTVPRPIPDEAWPKPCLNPDCRDPVDKFDMHPTGFCLLCCQKLGEVLECPVCLKEYTVE